MLPRLAQPFLASLARFVVVHMLALVALLTFSLGSFGLAGCRKPEGRAKVAVSVFPIYDLTRRIAGPDADVFLVVPKAADPRAFTPTREDVAAAAGVRLAISVGLGLDPWMEALVKDASPKARFLKVGDRVPPIASEPSAAADAHVWLDPQRARLVTKAIGEELARVDAAHATAFRKRAAELDAALEAFDTELEAKVSAWKRKAFVADGAGGAGLAYLADRYKLEIAPSKGGAPDPSLPKVSSIALDVFGRNTATDTYESVVRFNVDVLESATRAPAKP